MVLGDDLLQEIFARLDLLGCRRSSRINDSRPDDLSRGINDRQLAPCTECRVPSKDYPACDRRLHEKLMQVFPKDFDCSVFRLLCQFISDLPLDRRSDQPLIAVRRCLPKQGRCIRIVCMDHLFFQIPEDILLGRFYLDCQEFLLLPPVQCQDPVPGQL